MDIDQNQQHAFAPFLRTCLRLIFLAIFVVAILWLLNWAQSLTDTNPNLMIGVLLLIFAVYVILMAIPFVPGIEIGIALMVFKGPEIVPWVYLATVIGLSVSFLIGQYISLSYLHRVFADLKLRRLCRFIEAMQKLTPQERLNRIRDRLPKILRPILIEGRYIAVALALNIPGNALLGGGGGILMVVGLSRVFHTVLMILTISIAVAPIPLAIILFGLNPLDFFQR